MQRRPLLGYWGDPSSPGYVQLRLIKDDYDFSSGLFYSVQNDNFILAAAGFSNDGGDKHPSLRPPLRASCSRSDLNGVDVPLVRLSEERLLLKNKLSLP